MKPISRPRYALGFVAAAAALTVLAFPAVSGGQVPARSYWKSLAGSNAVPVFFMMLSGNSNPFDNAHIVVPAGQFDATVAPVGFMHTFALFDRSASAAIFVPMGRVGATVTTGVITVAQQASGFGDPLAEFDVNVIGKKASKTMPNLLLYEPGFAVDVLMDLGIPIGEYDASKPLNLGQNRWFGRVATPVVWQLGPWVPGRRTTLEAVPSLWLFGPNSDYLGQTLTTDPMFQLEGHVTRDLAKDLWASLDVTWVTGGKATIGGVAGESLNNLALGYTLGYKINDNIQTTFGYMATVNDNQPGDLQMDGFKLSIVFGWNPLVEGLKRIKGNE